jgi:hypothetical protein
MSRLATVCRRAEVARGLLACKLMPTTRTPLMAALLLSLLVVASTCGGGTLDPASGAGGTGGAQDGGQVCGPVCDNICAYGRMLDANGCPTCACKPDPGCPTLEITCRIYCAYGFATDANGCQTCQCAAGPICDGVAPERCTASLPPICDCDPGRTCAEKECGGPPPPVQPAPCPDGSVPPFECVRNDDRRTCGWHIRACPVITI